VFETLTLPSLDILVLATRAVLLLGAFCVFALAFIRWRAADARNNAQLLQQLERTFAEIRTLHETVAVMAVRLETLSERSDAGARLASAATAVSPRGYDIAARLAKNGADADALIENCGLTRQEAELMVRLHGSRATVAEPTVAARPVRVEPAATRAQPAQETRMPVQRKLPAPVLPVPSPEIRAGASGRRRGSLLSTVG